MPKTSKHGATMGWDKLSVPVRQDGTSLLGRIEDAASEMQTALGDSSAAGGICQIHTLAAASSVLMIQYVFGEIDERVIVGHTEWSRELVRMPWGTDGPHDVMIMWKEGVDGVGISFNSITLICMGLGFELNLAIAIMWARDLFGFHGDDALQVALHHDQHALVAYIREHG